MTHFKSIGSMPYLLVIERIKIVLRKYGVDYNRTPLSLSETPTGQKCGFEAPDDKSMSMVKKEISEEFGGLVSTEYYSASGIFCVVLEYPDAKTITMFKRLFKR